MASATQRVFRWSRTTLRSDGLVPVVASGAAWCTVVSFIGGPQCRSAERTRSQKPTQPTAMPRKMPTRANAGEVSRRVVDQQADDQPADDGTDQERRRAR